jgi:hypothetical protein
MSQRLTRIVGILFALLATATARQLAPNLSGDWVIASAIATGTRAKVQGATPPENVEVRTSANTASGAAFNCGRQCTIVHRGETLTLREALLGSETQPAVTVSLQLDGRRHLVADSFSPGREIPVTAAWRGTTLEIVSTSGTGTITQTIALDGSELVVMTSDSREPRQRVTFRYKKR